MEKDMKWFKSINMKSMELFGKPINHLNNPQMDQVFLAEKAKSSKQQKVVKIDKCQVVPPTFAFETTTELGYKTAYATNWKFTSLPSNPDDYDCQIAYPNVNPKLYKLFGVSIEGKSLLQRYGKYVSGRIKKNGSDAATYPVFGIDRVRLTFLDLSDNVCQRLVGTDHIWLTDNLVSPKCEEFGIYYNYECNCCNEFQPVSIPTAPKVY